MTDGVDQQSKRLEHAVVAFASAYAKNYLVRHYDRLAKSRLGRHAQGLDPSSKKLLELALMSLGSLLATQRDKFLVSPIKTVIWEIINDTPPELIARLLRVNVNASISNTSSQQASLEEQLALISSSINELDEKRFQELLEGITTLPEDDRKRLVSSLVNLAEANIESKLGPNPFQAGSQNEQHACGSEGVNSQVTIMGPVLDEIARTFRDSTKRLTERRERLAEKSNSIDKKTSELRSKKDQK